MSDPHHDRDLARAFDGQAVQFERAPVQSDPQALARLVAAADLAPDRFVLDAGCGPGLVAEAFLEAGHRVVGVDLSEAMIARARLRCERFGPRAHFLQGSAFDADLGGPFDAAVSRYVLHHLTDPRAFLARLAALVYPGGVILVSDHTTDPNPEAAAWHQEVEVARDRTHTGNFTSGAVVDLFAGAGLVAIRLEEFPFRLDFDEWFDRGTPSASKPAVRARILSGATARGFAPEELSPGGPVRIDCWQAVVRGIKPSQGGDPPDPASDPGNGRGPLGSQI